MKHKKGYIKHYLSHPSSFSLFQSPGWLDVVCSAENWTVVSANNAEKGITVYLALYKSNYLGFNLIKMPVLTPYLGPVFISKDNSIPFEQFTRSSDYYILTEQLIHAIPKSTYFSQRFGPHIINDLPFRRRGYKSDVFYTYRLNISNLESVKNDFKSKLKNTIRRADSHISVEESTDIKILFDLIHRTFANQGLRPSYTYSQLSKIYSCFQKNNNGILLVARDTTNHACGGILVCWDHDTAYNLAMSTDKSIHGVGITQLLLWKAISYASGQRLQYFDFEGGMIPMIENVFRVFKGRLTPYFHMYKAGNKMLHLYNELRKD